MKSVQNILSLSQRRRFCSSAGSDVPVTRMKLNWNGSSSQPSGKPPQAPKGSSILSAPCSTFSLRPYQEYKSVTWEDTGIDVFINIYYGHLLSCFRILPAQSLPGAPPISHLGAPAIISLQTEQKETPFQLELLKS